MIRNDMDDISDEDFDNVVLPCEKILNNYVKNKILDDYVAFHIATCYNGNAMWNEPFDLQVNTAIEDLSQFTKNDCNYKNIKRILEREYKLKVVNESPIDIKELRAE